MSAAWRERLRAVLIGAVESSLVALHAIARSPAWELAAVVSLPPEKKGRHDDFVDLSEPARKAGAAFVPLVNVNGDQALEQLRAHRPDFLFVIGWSQICGPEVLAVAPERIIGYHPAPLPRMRGRAAIPWTILQKEPITAGTLFWLDHGMDSGSILDQHFFHVDPEETAGSLYARHLATLDLMLDRTLPSIAAGTARREAQDERYATWTARRTAADGLIDWRRPADDVATLVRAVGRPYSGASSNIGTSPITILACRVSDVGWRHVALPGQVIAASETSFTVACGQSSAVEVTDWLTSDNKPPRMHSILGVRP